MMTGMNMPQKASWFKDRSMLALLVNIALVAALLATISYLATLIQKRLTPPSKYLCRTKRSCLDFSGIQPLPHFDIAKTQPHPYRPWKAGTYSMIMGLLKMPEEDWLILDKLYSQEQDLRRFLLRTNRSGVMQCLPPAEEACEEALDYIVRFLTKRYPAQFQLPMEKPGYIFNAITSRTFKVSFPYEQHPLEVAAQLVMEDVNLLLPGTGGDPQEYFLQASFSMAPAGWDIQERIGWPLWRVHGPVPMWKEKLGNRMHKFLLRLEVSNPVQRNSYFIQVGGNLFQQKPFPDNFPRPPKIEDIYIRHERQTLRKLPRTGAIIFMVRTYLTPVIELREEVENLLALRASVNALPPEMASYKGRHIWGGVLEQWCKQILENENSGRDENVQASGVV